MKPEEPDEPDLKENDLSTWLQYGLPIFLRKNGSYLLLAVALCILGYQLYQRYEIKKQVEVQSAWNDLDAASAPGVDNAPAKLQALISQYPMKPIQALAYVQLASFYLDDVAHGNPPAGYHGVKVSRDDALKLAESAANSVLSDYADQPVAVGKARFALAAVAMNRGDFAAARKEYELLTDKSGPYAGTAFAELADNQLKKLDQYAKAPPLAAFAPPEQPPSTAPAGLQDLSQIPGLSGTSAPDLNLTLPP
ncbi:MAG TPA: hypothetical protein VM008_08765, partial [Phycisphaerae bacterium]|nr:hypothetical protein [Phycisphaerae bacterium]